ncbi:MAG: LD-carboxypeptidase [Candidatus Sumerlaeia bacterium]|nr:LD-carboxypeptidase [Candidatus Sumerlaeia bacterium]
MRMNPGDTIAFVAPARSQSTDRIEGGAAGLKTKGYEILYQPNLETQYRGFLNAPDEERARLINVAFANPEVDAVFPVAGGYTSARILDFLDYDLIRKNPKPVIGYSDITALHLGLYAKAGIVSFHSPFPTYFYVGEGDKSFAIDHFWAVLESPESAYPMTLPLRPASVPVETFVPGKARGKLVGGNLSLIHALHGTPYGIPENGKGHLLFLEEIGEEPYRVDRMLWQLQHAGILDNVEGVIIGRFHKCETDDPTRSHTLRQVFEDHFKNRPYPVVLDFPVGHVTDNLSLPIGVMAELDADKGTVTLLESPVAERR